MEGKVCVVTGATSGIGKETARALAAAGARVAIVGRNPQKAEAAAAEIRRTARGDVDVLLADLSTLEATRGLAATLAARCPRIDVLVNNAGVFRMRRTLTPDGIEETFGVNHLAPFLLTSLLLDHLRSSAPARIVTTASEAHRGVRLDFDDLQGERRYSGWRAYCRSKLANIMFTSALARRLEGSGVTATCYHPGFVATNLGSGNRLPIRPFMAIGRLFGARTPAQGADTAAWLASSPDVDGASGGYYDSRRERRPSEAARDEDAQEQLWKISAELTGAA